MWQLADIYLAGVSKIRVSSVSIFPMDPSPLPLNAHTTIDSHLNFQIPTTSHCDDRQSLLPVNASQTHSNFPPPTPHTPLKSNAPGSPGAMIAAGFWGMRSTMVGMRSAGCLGCLRMGAAVHSAVSPCCMSRMCSVSRTPPPLQQTDN